MLIVKMAHCSSNVVKKKIHSGCEIEGLVQTHLRKLRVILRLSVLLGVCVLIKDFSPRLDWNYNVASTRVNRAMLINQLCGKSI